MGNYPRAKTVPKARKVRPQDPNKYKANSKAFNPKGLKKSVDVLIKQMEGVAPPTTQKCACTAKGKVLKKGTKGLVGAGLGGLVGGAVAGPLGAGMGAMAGSSLGSSMEKKAQSKKVVKCNTIPKVETKKAIPAIALAAKPLFSKITAGGLGKIAARTGAGALGARAGWDLGGAGGKKAGNAAKEMGVPGPETFKSADVKKDAKGLIGAGLGGLVGSALGPVGAGLGAMAGGGLAGGIGKAKIKSTPVKHQQKIARPIISKEINYDLLKTKSQASLRVEKAIQLLEGYAPMTDDVILKMFHGQIPEVMQAIELRPSQTWWDTAISKAVEFGSNDPIKYSLDLWYNIPDVNKAVAEKIDSKYSPEKRGEEKAINDGARLSTEDIKPTETTVTN